MLPINMASSALGMGAGLLGGAGGAVLGGIGSLVSTASGAINSIFQGIISGAQSVVKVVGDGLGTLSKLAGEVFSGILTIGQDVLNEARSYGRNIRSIGFQTGIGEGAASNMANSFAFAGVSPQSLSNTFSSPQATLSIGMRAKMLGLPDPTVDPSGFLLGGARAMQNARQGGMGGALMFNAMAGPQMTGAFGSAWDLGPDRLKRNMAMADSFKLPGNIGEYSRDLDAFSIGVEALGRNLKLTLAEVLVPLMPQINAGFSLIIQNKGAIISAIQTVGKWVVGELPAYIMQGGAAILRTTATVFEKVGTFLTGTFQTIGQNTLKHLPAILQGFQSFIGGMSQMATFTIATGTAIAQAAYNFSQTTAGKWLTNAAGGGASATGSTGSPATSNPTPGTTSTSAPTAFSPFNPSFAPFAPSGGGGASNGTTNYAQTVPMPQNGGNTNSPWGRLGIIAAGAAAGAGGGYLVGRKVGAIGLGIIGGIAGGIIGFGAGGVGLVPGAIAGASAGAATGGTWGGGIGAIVGGLGGAYAAAQTLTTGQQAYYGTGNASTNNSGTSANPTVVVPTGGPATPAGGALLAPQPTRTIGQAYQAGQAWAQSLTPNINVTQYQNDIAKTIKALDARAMKTGDWMLDKAPGLRETADKMDAGADSWRERVLGLLERNANSNEAIANHTDQNVQKTADLLRALGPTFFSNLVARTSAIIAEDFAANILRAG
ncbi:hypothetical protein EON83_27705 [bacterium]|nr:MAG: hypothetical protein EON83_27705 [bacterium]